jgi:hypothetical protein
LLHAPLHRCSGASRFSKPSTICPAFFPKLPGLPSTFASDIAIVAIQGCSTSVLSRLPYARCNAGCSLSLPQATTTQRGAEEARRKRRSSSFSQIEKKLIVAMPLGFLPDGSCCWLDLISNLSVPMCSSASVVVVPCLLGSSPCFPVEIVRITFVVSSSFPLLLLGSIPWVAVLFLSMDGCFLRYALNS